MNEILQQLNQKAVEDGLMLADGRSDREDFSPLLGTPLSVHEEECYGIIVQETPRGPVSTENIYKTLFDKPESYKLSRNDQALIWVLVARLRNKMGHEELIGKPGLGYQSRRILNSLLVSPGRIELPFRV